MQLQRIIPRFVGRYPRQAVTLASIALTARRLAAMSNVTLNSHRLANGVDGCNNGGIESNWSLSSPNWC